MTILERLEKLEDCVAELTTQNDLVWEYALAQASGARDSGLEADRLLSERMDMLAVLGATNTLQHSLLMGYVEQLFLATGVEEFGLSEAAQESLALHIKNLVTTTTDASVSMDAQPRQQLFDAVSAMVDSHVVGTPTADFFDEIIADMNTEKEENNVQESDLAEAVAAVDPVFRSCRDDDEALTDTAETLYEVDTASEPSDQEDIAALSEAILGAQDDGTDLLKELLGATDDSVSEDSHKDNVDFLKELLEALDDTAVEGDAVVSLVIGEDEEGIVRECVRLTMDLFKQGKLSEHGMRQMIAIFSDDGEAMQEDGMWDDVPMPGRVAEQFKEPYAKGLNTFRLNVSGEAEIKEALMSLYTNSLARAGFFPE